jgi:hypothetical protein
MCGDRHGMGQKTKKSIAVGFDVEIRKREYKYRRVGENKMEIRLIHPHFSAFSHHLWMWF